MRLLIDSHVFLWYFAGIKLSQKAKDLLTITDDNEIYFSYASAWEIFIKYGVGKLNLPSTPEVFVPERVRLAGFLFLPINLQHVLRVYDLPSIHRDPFDRLLISQAKAENLTILTADPVFAEYEIKSIDIASISNG